MTLQQQLKSLYVAITRARSNLFIIEESSRRNPMLVSNNRPHREIERLMAHNMITTGSLEGKSSD